jgi:thioredoxin-like negative regulator of GroEL
MATGTSFQTAAPPHVIVSTAQPEPITRKNSLPWILAAVFLASTVTLGATWLLSAPMQVPSEIPEVSSSPDLLPVVTEHHHENINQALADLRAGMATHALSALRALRSENPRIPSIDYLVALAALQAGEQEEAYRSIDASISKGEKVSDALALRAAVEAQTESDAVLRSVEGIEPASNRLLRQAMQADPSNPFPHIELANRLRARGQDAEARTFLESARLRLQPVDPHIIADVSLHLMDLASQPDEALPSVPAEAASIPEIFGAAYLAFRAGQPERGNVFLQQARAMLPEDLYAYLLGDPALRKVIPSPGVVSAAH